MAKGIFSSLKGMDAFGKTMEDVKVKTRTGAFLTILSVAFILSFMTIEFFDYRRVTMDTSILVDKSRGEKLTVNMNITFPRVPCYLLSLDVMDISGESQRDLSHNVIKKRLDRKGVPVAENAYTAELKNEVDKMVDARADNYCGSCYGGLEPASGCCNTCEQVRQAYVNRGWSFGNPDAIEQCVSEGWTDKIKEQATEGCNISGRIRVNKVIGNFQFSPGRSFQTHATHVNDLVPYLKDGLVHDFGHQIHTFMFENDDEYNVYKNELSAAFKRRMGIANNPLDGTFAAPHVTQYMFQYFLKVVSTQFNTIGGETVNTHQYSVTNFERDLSGGNSDKTADGVTLSHGVSGMPGAFFNFEISPMLIVHTETRQSFAHFLTSTCAIVGGVLTIASIVDSVVFATNRVLKNKAGSVHNGNGYGGKLM